MASRREAALLFKLRLWQKLCCKQSSIGGRYWVGYHREWFLTIDKNRFYGFHLGRRVPARNVPIAIPFAYSFAAAIFVQRDSVKFKESDATL